MKRQAPRRIASTAALSAAALSLVVGVTPAVHGRKPAPPPCVADGTCVPSRGTWGHYETRWNRWPGDVAATPSGPDEADDGEEAVLPEGPVTPRAIEEDQQGPAKPTSEQDPAAAGESAMPTPNMATPDLAPGGELTPEVELPGIDQDDSLFDPFGRHQQDPGQQATAGAPIQQAGALDVPLPVEESPPTLQDVLRTQEEDAPPALPAGLMRSIGRTPAGQPSGTQARRVAEQLPSADLPLAQPASLQVLSPRRAIDHRGTEPIRQTAWADDAGIHVIRPATAATDQPTQGVQQAIYIEASDQ